MELDIIKEFLSSKEAMLSLGNLCLIEDGLKIKMYGHPTMTSSGLPESVILISWV